MNSNIVKLLEKYAFNKQNIHKLISSEYFEKNVEKNEKNIIKPEVDKHVDFFIPDQDDGLFWCWFIFVYGFSQYEILKNNNFVIEKQYKIKFIDKLRNNKKKLKEMKVKITDMEGHLANDPELNINYLEPMLILDKYNFVYMTDKFYYSNINIPDNKTCIIKYFEKLDKYGFFLEKDKLSDYTNKLLLVESIKKPIKSISNYKAQQIKDICKKLNIDIMKTPTKCKTKKELYKLVIEKII
jgi:hypothetical protein|tara:strand:- start:1015 stop:1734 length:720 start_codon:yes stop_codon:yes gene_type:complete